MTNPKIYDIIRGSVNDDPVDVQKAFNDAFLDKVRDVVDDRKAQMAASFLGGQKNDDDIEEVDDDDYDIDDEIDDDLDLDDIDLEDIDDDIDTDIDSDDNTEQDYSDETA